jgi:hypothetical protein
MTEQVVFRAPEELYEALQRDANENGRTVAQSARFHLARVLEVTPPARG